MVKVFSSEVANRVADKAVQIFWGHGLMKGHPVEKMYRDIRMFRILMGQRKSKKGDCNRIAKKIRNEGEFTLFEYSGKERHV
ncbi:acyl-CoA dehydrogenase family protein [Peribacillus sp. NPDC101480]|uniref:acyl-CoA dehydrogenase family protein n=1 Tax=Peribacillus sp. NPDC101480 TaxID=3390620 RepID=UPI003D02B6C3